MVRCRHNTPKAITMMMALADLCLMMAVVCLCRMLALETLVKAWICIICSLFTLSLKVPDPQHLACSIPPAGDSPETRESLRSFRLKRKACDSNFAYFSDILIFYLQQSKIIGCSPSICSLHYFWFTKHLQFFQCSSQVLHLLGALPLVRNLAWSLR